MTTYHENNHRGDFIAPPWWKKNTDDYTRNRTGELGYTMDALIGRKDVNKYVLTTTDPTTVSGTPGTLLK